MKYIELDNYTIIIGKNKYENWECIDNANENDYWFHLKDYPSCHVILKNNNNMKIDRKIIKYCCLECKKNSKYKSEKVTVCYTQIKNISKGRSIGSVNIINEKIINI